MPPEAPQGLCPRCLLAGASLATEDGQRTDPKSPPPALEELVTAFPQLEIIELIGQGGMGFVFKARQPKLDRLVALKILPQSLATDPAFAERFAREARLLARLNHPNIVTIHDFGQANGFFYLLMEYVDGVNLRQAMRGGRFTADQALAIVPKICDALQYAHEEGVLHRDIKPENIMLDGRGRVKIADFGIAKLMGNPANRSAPLPLPLGGGEGVGVQASACGLEEGITETGRVLGTPHYMAPEQIETPGRVDHRADIYSLGVVFYEMLTGELPLGRFAPPSQKSAADPRLDDVVIRTLAKEPERRTQSAEEVKTQVETISSGGTYSKTDDARAGRDAANSARFSIPAMLVRTRRSWQVVAGTFVFVALVVFGLIVPLHFDWWASTSGNQPEAIVTAWPVPAENQLPGRTVWRWKCSIPANHALVFEMVSYTPDGVATVVDNLSSSLVVGSKNVRNEVFELALQDGAKLSPDLQNQFRWDRSWKQNGNGGEYAPVWTNKPPDLGATLGLSDGTSHVHEWNFNLGYSNLLAMLFQRSGPSPREFRLLELHVLLQAVPKDLTFASNGMKDVAASMDDANWLTWLQKRRQAREHPASAATGAASEQELEDRFETALKARDTNAIFALYNLQGVSDKMKPALVTSRMWKGLTEAPNNGTRVSSELLPLPTNYETEMVRDGIRYTPNVSLLGMISGNLSWEENGTNFGRGFQFPYGKQGDRYYLAGSAETRIYEPKTKDKALLISVATSNNQAVAAFSGTFTYVQNGQEIEKEIKGPASFNRVAFGDYVKSCVVRKTSDDQNSLQVTISENGSNVFSSGWVHTTNQIVYERKGATSRASAWDGGQSNETTPAGQTATFSVTASGTAPLTYQWMFNGSNNSGMANALPANLFREFALDRTEAELARTPNPDTPESVVAAVIIGVVEGDPAAAMGRYVLDEPRFPAGTVKIKATEQQREWSRQARTDKVIIYRDGLAGVIMFKHDETGDRFITIVAGHRNGEWKVYDGADLPDTATVADAEAKFREQAAGLWDSFQKLPDTPPDGLAEAGKTLATNMTDVMGTLMNSMGLAVGQMANQQTTLIPRMVSNIQQMGTSLASNLNQQMQFQIRPPLPQTPAQSGPPAGKPDASK